MNQASLSWVRLAIAMLVGALASVATLSPVDAAELVSSAPSGPHTLGQVRVCALAQHRETYPCATGNPVVPEWWYPARDYRIHARVSPAWEDSVVADSLGVATFTRVPGDSATVWVTPVQRQPGTWDSQVPMRIAVRAVPNEADTIRVVHHSSWLSIYR